MEPPQSSSPRPPSARSHGSTLCSSRSYCSARWCSGLVAGAYGVDSRTVALVWFLGGMLMLVSDLVISNEDVAFHATLAVFTAAVAAGAAWVGRRIRGARSPEPSSAG